MDLFKKPELSVHTEGSVEWLEDQVKNHVINPSKHFKRFGTKKPIDKFMLKKLNWREEDL